MLLSPRRQTLALQMSLCRVVVSVLVVWCVSATSGCHRGPAMAQVKGKVTYKDGSIPQGGVKVVRFWPSKDSTAEVRKGATGMIESDGSFELWTRQAGDGAYLGEYVVTFAVQKSHLDPNSSLISSKYTNPSTSPYKVTITGNVDDLKYELEPLPGVTGGAATDGTAASTPPSSG